MYLTDLTFIEDGNQDFLQELVNFSKRTFVANVIQEIQQYQQTPYALTPVESIMFFLSDLETRIKDKEQCYQISLKILPRGGAAASTTTQPASTSTAAASTTSTPAPTPNKEEFNWGEMEEIPGYVFNVPDSSKNIKLLANTEAHSPPKVAAGTIEKLIERVTHQAYPDPQFLEIFLLTYRTFITGKQLIDYLVMRFNMPLPKNPAMVDKYKVDILLPIQLRVINFLKNWTEKYPYDFIIDKSLRDSFNKFANTNTSIHAVKLKRISKQLKTTILSLKSGDSIKKPQINTPNTPFPGTFTLFSFFNFPLFFLVYFYFLFLGLRFFFIFFFHLISRIEKKSFLFFYHLI